MILSYNLVSVGLCLVLYRKIESEDKRLAKTHPADPAPTIMWLNSEDITFDDVENALLEPLLESSMRNDL